MEKARDRVLDEDEIATLWRACADEGVTGASVRIMLLTGARRTEVSAMRWAEIDEETRTWVLPSERSKNRQAHVVPWLAATRRARRGDRGDTRPPQRRISRHRFHLSAPRFCRREKTALDAWGNHIAAAVADNSGGRDASAL